jgi:hypothetical protein
MPRPGKWPLLEQLGTPMHEALSGFIHRPSDDPTGRTVAVTTLVVTLWQLAGRRMSHRLPSLVLVNAGGNDTDPDDLLASHLLAAPASGGPRIYHEGHFMGGTPEQAPAAMAGSIREKQELGAVTPWNASIHTDIECRYFDAQRTGFGCGPTRAYATAWHDSFGLITDRGGELILRLDSRDDRGAFRDDVLARHDRLRGPVGYGTGLELIPKTTAVSGSLPEGMWDAGFAGKMVDLSLPMLVLPSPAQEAPVTGNPPALDIIASTLPGAFDRPVDEPANFIPGPWFAVYQDELRRRLRHLPADYEYSIHKLARQIFPVCQRIAGWCGRGASRLEVEALWLELCMHTLRGVVLSIAGLAWHGLGFDAGCARPEALRVLEYLRDKGPMTKGELLRRAHLKKEQRDILLEQFAAESLVHTDGNTVAATSYMEFVVSLHAREELPEPADLWSEVAGKG